MRREPTRQDAEKLIKDAEMEGVDHVELIRRLLLIDQISAWSYQRLAGEGSERIKEVEVHPLGFTVTTWSDERLEYSAEATRQRWRWDRGRALVSRTEAERYLGVWPGYLDALEDLFRHISLLKEELKREQKEFLEKTQKDYFQMSEELRVQAANERHPELRRWRELNPSQLSGIPEKLKHIRNLKQVQVSEPCHIYFLLKKREVVYVGQTSATWPGRIIQHLRAKQKLFDDVWCLEVDRPSLNTIERKFINQFKPRYNGMRSSLEDQEDDGEEPA